MESKLHRELSQRSLIWLANKATGRGINGNIEVKIQKKYVVDALALCRCVNNFELDLYSEGDWEKKKEIIIKKNTLKFWDKMDIELYPDFVFAFETKVTYGDFSKTFKKENNNRLVPVANFHFIVTPYNLIDPAIVPDFWGLLEKSKNGRGLTLKKYPKFQSCTINHIYKIGYILLRNHKKIKWSCLDERAFYRQTALEI